MADLNKPLMLKERSKNATALLRGLIVRYNLLIKDYLWRFIQTIGKYGLNLILFYIFSYFLTPYDFGIYNLVLSYAYLLILFSDFGISTATSKFIAEYYAIDKKKYNSLISGSSLIVSSLGVFIVLLVLVVGRRIFNNNYF